MIEGNECGQSKIKRNSSAVFSTKPRPKTIQSNSNTPFKFTRNQSSIMINKFDIETGERLKEDLKKKKPRKGRPLLFTLNKITLHP